MPRYTRWCGDIRLRLTLRTDDSWRVNLYVAPSASEGPVQARVFVNNAPCLPPGVCIDSPANIDSVAHAALSFAIDDGAPLESHADCTDNGWRIRRTVHA